MINFDFKLEDKECMKFIRIQAENNVEALSKAIKESDILNPLNVFQRREGGKFEVLDLKASQLTMPPLGGKYMILWSFRVKLRKLHIKYTRNYIC